MSSSSYNDDDDKSVFGDIWKNSAKNIQKPNPVKKVLVPSKKEELKVAVVVPHPPPPNPVAVIPDDISCAAEFTEDQVQMTLMNNRLEEIASVNDKILVNLALLGVAVADIKNHVKLVLDELDNLQKPPPIQQATRPKASAPKQKKGIVFEFDENK